MIAWDMKQCALLHVFMPIGYVEGHICSSRA